MNLDVNEVLFGGLVLVPILVFVVQTIREAIDVQDRLIPLLVVGVAVLMGLVNEYAPASLVHVLAVALAVSAVTSATVRYTKEGLHTSPLLRQKRKLVTRRSPAVIREAKDT